MLREKEMTDQEREDTQAAADQLAAHIEEIKGDLEVHELLKETRPTEVMPEASVAALRESMERAKIDLAKLRYLLADFTVSDEGSLCLLTPQTAAAKAWIESSLSSERSMMGEAVAIERRYIEPICMGIVGETEMVLVKDGMLMYATEDGELLLRP